MRGGIARPAMKINPPSTTERGVPGAVIIENVDFKTAQDINVKFHSVNRKVLISRISILSMLADTISNGATVLVREADPNTLTPASTTLTSDATAPSNGDTVTLGNKTYTFRTLVKATATLTSDATAPSNNDTVTIGGQVYTFKTALTSGTAANEVLIGVSAAVALDNLKSAINKSAGGGTAYGSNTVANAYVTATTNSNTDQVVEALDAGTAGNLIAVSEASTHLTWGASVTTLSGGTDPTVEGEVKVGISAATALDNLKAAVNHSAGNGTLYFCAAAHTQFTATTNTDTTQVFSATLAPGMQGNSLATTEASTHLSFTGLVAAGGLDGTLKNPMVASTDLADSDDTGNVQVLSFATDNEAVTDGNSLMISITAGSTATTDTKNIVIEYVFVD